MTILLSLYSLLLTLALLLSSPWWLFRMFTTSRYREGIAQRLGRVPKHLRTNTENKRTLWLHAVSVGEVLAASRLIPELESALGPSYRIVISTTTRTGQTLARQRFGAHRVFYMPLDFAFAIRPYLNALKPAALILMESELWPRMLHECRRRNIPVAVVNARISDRSFARALRVRFLWKHILRKPTLWLAQSEQDATRLQTLIQNKNTPITNSVILSEGRSPQSKDLPPSQPATTAQTISTTNPQPTIHVTGNLKYDIRAPKQSRIATLIREAAAGRKIVVGGSTIDGDPPEDSWLIRACESMHPGTRPLLVLAPRHPENFEIIYSMAVEHPTLRATELPQQNGKPVDIIVLNTIGDLAAVYSIADIAFVGGSLVKCGGHNPLEPAQFGVPVIMGPSFENFRDIVTTMQSANAIQIVPNGDALRDALLRLLDNPAEARALGERGRAVYEAQQGTTTRAVEAIVSLINETSGAKQ